MDGDEYETISDLEFVPTSYYDCDETYEYVENDVTKVQSNYTIYMFGRMENGESLTLQIDDYNPSFTIRIPNSWKKNECRAAIAHFKKIYTTTVKRGAKDSDLLKTTIEKHHDLYEHFCDNKLFRYMKFHFRSQEAHNRFARVFFFLTPNLSNFDVFSTIFKVNWVYFHQICMKK